MTIRSSAGPVKGHPSIDHWAVAVILLHPNYLIHLFVKGSEYSFFSYCFQREKKKGWFMSDERIGRVVWSNPILTVQNRGRPSFIAQSVSTMKRAMVRFLLLLLVTTQLTSDADSPPKLFEGKHLIVVLGHASFLTFQFYSTKWTNGFHLILPHFYFYFLVSSFICNRKKFIGSRHWLFGVDGWTFRLAFETTWILVSWNCLIGINFFRRFYCKKLLLKKVHDAAVGLFSWWTD